MTCVHGWCLRLRLWHRLTSLAPFRRRRWQRCSWHYLPGEIKITKCVSMSLQLAAPFISILKHFFIFCLMLFIYECLSCFGERTSMDRLQLFFCELIQKQQSGAPLTPLFTGADGLRKWPENYALANKIPRRCGQMLVKHSRFFLKHLY